MAPPVALGGIGSMFSNITKSASSALNNILSLQQKQQHYHQQQPSPSHYHQHQAHPVPPNINHPPPPLPPSRSASPRDIGFSSAVSDIVDQAHNIASADRRGRYIKPKGWYL